MMINLGALYSDDQLRRAQGIFEKHKDAASFTAMKAELRREIVDPSMDHINTVTGQKNDPDYMAYALIHILLQLRTK